MISFLILSRHTFRQSLPQVMKVVLMEIYNQMPEEFTLHLYSLFSLTDLKTCKVEHFDFADGLLKEHKDYLSSPLMSSYPEAALAT